MRKERVDIVLVEKGLAESLQKAQAFILAGLVFSEGQRIEKPGQRIPGDQEIVLKEKMPYVSRGGLKLHEALDAFNISVEVNVAADLGVSTGGFCDCLLQRGASKVYAVDVDTKQLDWRLRKDSRVVLIEKNARYLKKDDFDETLDVVTTDLSFISILKVLPAVKEFLEEGKLISLVKPQFEVDKGEVGKKGIIKDQRLHEKVLGKIIREALSMGFIFNALHRNSVSGLKGNREFFVYWTLHGKSLDLSDIERLIKEAVWNEKA